MTSVAQASMVWTPKDTSPTWTVPADSTASPAMPTVSITSAG